MTYMLKHEIEEMFKHRPQDLINFFNMYGDYITYGMGIVAEFFDVDIKELYQPKEA